MTETKDRIILEEYCNGWQQVGITNLPHWRLLRLSEGKTTIIIEENNDRD